MSHLERSLDGAQRRDGPAGNLPGLGEDRRQNRPIRPGARGRRDRGLRRPQDALSGNTRTTPGNVDV